MKSERGLPAPDDLLKLARAYLACQHRLWPEMAGAGILPPDDEATAQLLAADFARRHAGGTPPGDPAAGLPARLRRLAAAYLRYSCDNSNPRSLDNQLGNVLRKARELGLFVPWALVFADASISGMDPSRRGYRSLKDAVKRLPDVEAIVIDEFTRASRDTFEWFRLSFFARQLHKNVLGATDGFDLTSPQGEMMLQVFGMLARFFIARLRESVRSGMRGAADRGTGVGRPPLGYGLEPVRDADGRPVVGRKGRPTNRVCVHPETMRHVRRAVDMLVRERRSPGDIAREFNRLRVDGLDTWTGTSIRRLLWNPVYYGFLIYNRTRNERDPETGRRVVVENPRDRRVVKIRPDLRVWSRADYVAVRRILYRARRGSKLVGRARTCRKDSYPVAPVEAQLVCRCGHRINRVRGGADAALGCFHGQHRSHGCTMTTVKALRIVQEVVLGWVRQHLLTDATVDRLVDGANAALGEEAARPREDTAPLRAEVAELTRQREQLVDVLAGAGGNRDHLQALADRVVSIQKRIVEALARAREAERRDAPPPLPLRRADVAAYLDDLRGVLDQAPGAAAAALSRITGPIRVDDERYPDKKRGGRWVLTFTPSLLRPMAERAASRAASEPDGADGTGTTAAAASATLAFLADRGGGGWGPDPVVLVVDRCASLHERLASEVAPYVDRVNPATGKAYTAPEVATAIGQSKHVVHLTWRLVRRGYARAGDRRYGPPVVAAPVANVAEPAA